jgi:putative component of toxin-antitoxin plasmid stabilization module
MEIYFNPYPGAVRDEQEGLRCIVEAADAFVRAKKGLQSFTIAGRLSGGEVQPSRFLLVRSAGIELRVKDILYKAAQTDRLKIQLLMEVFSRGKVLDKKDLENVENWILTNIGTAAPLIELAAKNGAVVLTIPTEREWKLDILHFEKRSEIVHNLWGQRDISGLVEYCIATLENSKDRFSVRFNAYYCGTALNDAPSPIDWDNLGFFTTMARAQDRTYLPDDNLIKDIGKTRHGPLLELRIVGPGQRIFFVYRKGIIPEVLIGGFYNKNQGSNEKKQTSSQSRAIENAKRRINKYQDQGA